MNATLEILSFEITTFRRPAPGDIFHPGRYWSEVRRAGTDDVVHTTAEHVVPSRASEAAQKWIDEQGGRVVGRPHEAGT